MHHDECFPAATRLLTEEEMNKGADVLLQTLTEQLGREPQHVRTPDGVVSGDDPEVTPEILDLARIKAFLALGVDWVWICHPDCTEEDITSWR